MFKNTLIFFFVLTLFLTGEYFGLKTLRSRFYTAEKYQTLITNTSPMRDKTDNPCQYSILGEPPLPPNQYVKIHLYCPSGQKSLNTLDPRALPDLSYQGIIQEIGRINGFTVTFTDNLPHLFVCSANGSSIIDYQQKATPPVVITCLYDQTQ